MYINKKNFAFTLVMLAFLEPALFSEILLLDNLYLVFKIIAGLYAIYDVFIRNKFRLTSFQIVVFMFFGSLILTTAMNKGDVYNAFRTVFFNSLTVIYFDYCLREDSNRYLSVFIKLILTLASLNMILLFLFPNGFGIYISGYTVTVDSRLNLLGKDNGFIFFFILAIAVAFCNGVKRNITVTIVITLVTMIYVFSGTGIIGCFLIVFYALALQGKKISRFFNFWNLSIAYIVIYYSVVVMRVQELFSNFIEGYLGKDITFTGRTYLWDTAFIYILKKRIIGYGISEKMLVAQSGIAYSPHNLILQILLAGGAISLIIFVALYVMSGSKLKSYYKLSNILAVAIFTYLITSLTESTMNTQYLYLLFVLAYNVDLITLNKKDMYRRL